MYVAAHENLSALEICVPLKRYHGRKFHTKSPLTNFAGITLPMSDVVSTLRPRQNGRHFPDGILKLNLLNENVWISIEISLKVVPKSLINNIPALVQIMAWRRAGDKQLSKPMMTQFHDAYMRHSASMS